MKILIILTLFFLVNLYAQEISIKGKIVDAVTSQPLENANILLIDDEIVGTTSDSTGYFIFSGISGSNQILEITYLGYEKYSEPIANLLVAPNINLIKLTTAIISSQSVLVQAFRNSKALTPINYSSFEKEEIKENYTVQDIPEYLSALPSTTFYSESGNGIGYNYLSIRGFDQRRISVSINGIPQNDPEDHNVYWLDFPDLLASTELIQVQRGSGTGVIGYPAIGGSINIVTSSFSDAAQFTVKGSIGSHNTRKYSAFFSSGLVNKKYSFYVKFSQTLSSGYRDKSWVKFNSYHLSAVRYDDHLTTQLNFYGGPISDGLAYTGLPKFAIKDKESRRKNYSYWEADYDREQVTYKNERRAEEIENFSQPHFELLNDYKLNDDVKINSALFLVLGEGFFDYDASWADTSYFRLTQMNGFSPQQNPGNAIIRAQVENKQFGWIPRLSWAHNSGNLILGAEFRKHNSIHWGSINYADNLPSGVTKDYRYYYYNGGKDIVNIFANESYEINDDFTVLGELQLAYHKYKLFNEKYLNTDFEISNTFINSRFALNYKNTNGGILNLSYARVTREPRLKNYYDAAESSGGEVPQFERNPDGSFDFSRPYVQPETMNDIELGGYIGNDMYSASINLFYMLFDNEIVKNGKLDRFGQPITGNMEQTVHQGLELSAAVKFLDEFELASNLSLSRNLIKKGKYYLDAQNFIDLAENRISGFPDFLTNLILKYKNSNFYFMLTGKYVGSFYSDNFDSKINQYLILFPQFLNYNDNKNEAYFNADIFLSYKFHFYQSLGESKIFFQVNNLFDNLYSAYAIGKEFFPAAERNYLVGIQLGL